MTLFLLRFEAKTIELFYLVVPVIVLAIFFFFFLSFGAAICRFLHAMILPDDCHYLLEHFVSFIFFLLHVVIALNQCVDQKKSNEMKQ